MSVQQSYNEWATQYDSQANRTRDLEALALRQELNSFEFDRILEIGCGTGKNTVWLKDKCKELSSVDISENMLKEARAKINDPHVDFIQGDILGDWNFAQPLYDLVVFSLVLEHIENVQPIIQKAGSLLAPGGLIYIGELHPFRQYQGAKARFETAAGTQVVECYNHHFSDFSAAAALAGLAISSITEWFDDDDRQQIPRILSLLLRKGER